jgi:hypothetical protein
MAFILPLIFFSPIVVGITKNILDSSDNGLPLKQQLSRLKNVNNKLNTDLNLQELFNIKQAAQNQKTELYNEYQSISDVLKTNVSRYNTNIRNIEFWSIILLIVITFMLYLKSIGTNLTEFLSIPFVYFYKKFKNHN